MTDRSLDELAKASEMFRPTNFWGPGLEQLLGDMRSMGLDRFKRWPMGHIWFNPIYGNGWSDARVEAVHKWAVAQAHPQAQLPYMKRTLNGSQEARRDFDSAVTGWNQDRWPFDVVTVGESSVGSPPQAFSVVDGESARFGRAYANYMTCMAALSRHVDAPPTSFLEIGGGFGVLGEILMSRNPQTRYVDLDIPPLLTVASYYLRELFGDRVTVYDDAIPASGPITVPQSGVLPNYRIDDLEGEFEVFVNSFSFQEMEPDVVDNYIGKVCEKGLQYAVSFNSRAGKPKAEKSGDWGALDPVKSSDIVDMFSARGFRLLKAYDSPYVRSAGQLVVLRRD